ncbi:MAG: hypothetical protein N3F04_03925 [Candidatus Nezhaarchaeota archaeon]|nr:hypothetical protein [Candidatus Nezhaarchaeota archaeon]MCX8141913.1 hypothetical protein [Candidatus Nezhaarchaeota archaeon]MDW8050306.1 hypothetical protein [Nitrososphaerota archaeon]
MPSDLEDKFKSKLRLAHKVSLGYEHRNLMNKSAKLMGGYPYIALVLYDLLEERFPNKVDAIEMVINNTQALAFQQKLHNFMLLATSGVTLVPIPLVLLTFFYQQSMLCLSPLVIALFYGILLYLNASMMRRLVKTLV